MDDIYGDDKALDDLFKLDSGKQKSGLPSHGKSRTKSGGGKTQKQQYRSLMGQMTKKPSYMDRLLEGEANPNHIYGNHNNADVIWENK